MLIPLTTVWREVLPPMSCDRYLMISMWDVQQQEIVRISAGSQQDGILALHQAGTSVSSCLLRAGQSLWAATANNDGIIAVASISGDTSAAAPV